MVDIPQSSPHQGSPDRALCVGGFLDSTSAFVGVVVGMVLTLSLERRSPRAAQSNLPISPLGTGLGRWFTGCLTNSLLLLCLCGQDVAGLAGALAGVGSVSTPPGLLGPQALLEWGWGGAAGCSPPRLGEGHSSVQRPLQTIQYL